MNFRFRIKPYVVGRRDAPDEKYPYCIIKKTKFSDVKLTGYKDSPYHTPDNFRWVRCIVPQCAVRQVLKSYWYICKFISLTTDVVPKNFYLCQWPFQKKFVTPPVEEIPGGSVKVFGIPGGHTKNRGKNMNFQEGQCKKMENSRGITVNLTGNPGGSNSKKSISSTGEGVQFFSGKAHFWSN